MSLKARIKTFPIRKFSNNIFSNKSDQIAIEEPLEILLDAEISKNSPKTLSITMRTPGNDQHLALGFLYTEGIIRDFESIQSIETTHLNQIVIKLKANVSFKWKQLERHFYTSSSCGVCGKTSIEAVTHRQYPSLKADFPMITPQTLLEFPLKLKVNQSVFNLTGGIHAAALANQNGDILACMEDVGRHNALDKLIGYFLHMPDFTYSDKVLIVSGRISFELVQKAMMAGIPVMIAVGAPSSLAIELANSANMTLVGFVKENRFNIYSGQDRIHIIQRL